MSRVLGFPSVAQPLAEVAAAALELLAADGAGHRLLTPTLALR